MKNLLTHALRHKVTLERRVLASDNGGGYEETWEDVAILWASIRPLSGSESYRHGQVSARATHLFRLRYYAGIDPAMRFVFNERNFNIRSIRNLDEKSRVMEVLVEEGE